MYGFGRDAEYSNAQSTHIDSNCIAYGHFLQTEQYFCWPIGGNSAFHCVVKEC